MKSTEVQNPRHIQRIKPIMCGYWPCLAVYITALPGQFSLLHRLAASVCLVWGKAEPAIRPFRTILQNVPNRQTASIGGGSNFFWGGGGQVILFMYIYRQVNTWLLIL